jgi:alkylhydroperoxidase family enzyme
MRTFLLMAVLAAGLPAAAVAGDAPVSRLPRVSENSSDPYVKAMFADTKARGGQIINLQLTLANAPKVAQATQVLAYALRYDAKVGRQYRELAIMRTAQIAGADYEINQHKPMVLACGFTAKQLEGIADWRRNHLFDVKQSAVLAYAEEVAHGGNVTDATFANLSRQFDAQEILELTATITHYYDTALLTKALKIQIEDDGRKAAAGTC